MDVPLIDCDPATYSDARIAAAIDHALSTAGFMALVNLGIPPLAVNDALATAQAFFARPLIEKQRSAYGTAEENFGFQGLEHEALDPAAPSDFKETFTMRNLQHARLQDSRWPDATFKAAMNSFYAQAMDAARRLQRLLALALAVPGDFFVDCHGGENVTLRLLHYPQVDPEQLKSDQLGAGAHTDYGMLTLLMQDNVGGLQVQSADGGWHAVPARPEAVVINAGDLLERWSNGRYRSTPHRVMPNTANRDRYSIALFVDPDSATLVESLDSCVSDDNPPRYSPTTAGAHLQEKIQATHLER